MIIEGQVHGGLTDGVGIALMETIAFDEDGNCLAGSLMDYLIPTAIEVPDWETDFTVTPSPHHPIGAKGIGESATVGSPPTIVNAVCDAHRRPPRGHALHAVAGVGRYARSAMIKGDLVHRFDALVADRIPFVTATVVRTAKPTSVRPGDSAIVLADGTIEGFIGGTCAQASVRLHAARALETGEPVLMRLAPRRRRRDRRGRRARRPQPVPERRLPGDLPRPPAAGAAHRRRRRHADRPRARRRRARGRLRRRARRRAARHRRGGHRRLARDRRGGRAGAGARARRRLRRPRGQPQARRGRARVARRRRRAARADPHARRPGHRRAHAGRHRALDPRRARRRCAPRRRRRSDR